MMYMSFFVYVPIEILLCCTLVGACGPKAMNKILFEDRATVSYRQTSNISRTLVGNKIVDHSDVVGASPAGAASTTSSFST